MRRQDLPDVLAIENRVFPDPWPEQAFVSDLEDPRLAFTRVARDQGAVAGYLIAWRVSRELHLTNIAVAEDFRRRGVAQALLDELYEEARRVRAESITLEVRRSNEPAIALYRKNGFRQAGVRRNYYEKGHEDALVLTLELMAGGVHPSSARAPSRRGPSPGEKTS